MKRKGWFIPILVFFISISGLIFYQKRQDAHSFAAATSLPPILWSETSSNINKIIFSEGGQEIEVIRSSQDWELSKPIIEKADNLFIHNIISSFKEPALVEVIDIEPTQLQNYGIDAFSPTVKLYTKDTHVYELIRGIPADAFNDYVYSPMSNTVYTMPQTAFKTLPTRLASWRDKSLLAFDQSDVEKIDLIYNNTAYTLTPVTNSLDIRFKADGLEEDVLNRLIDFLQISTIKDFITDQADSKLLTAYGFDNPTVKVKIFLKNSDILMLTIGNSIKTENLSYAQTNLSGNIVTMPYFDLSGLKTLSTEEIEPTNPLK
ncbi:MAG: hypothetical protein K0S30_1221 [Clostridia bacterium]|jgi:hypothetical protein|nr:hypothetical protein [Clostridia bacterium]